MLMTKEFLTSFTVMTIFSIDSDLAVKFGMLKFVDGTAFLGPNIGYSTGTGPGGGGTTHKYESLTAGDLSTTGGKAWAYDSINKMMVLHPF